MIALQFISKILQTKDLSLYEDSGLTPEYFIGYEKEINYILEHKEKYGNIPDQETFIHHFTDENGDCSIQLVECTESDKYLVDTIREEYLYSKSVVVVQTYAELLKSDANAANEYLASMQGVLQPNYTIGGIDIVASTKQRYDDYKLKKVNPTNFYLESGFKELDELIRGIKRGEELLVVMARTNVGKSWVIEKMCTHVWKTGYNVGYISPEMSASSIGNRFDTLYKNFSNKGLMWGTDDLDEDAYEQYIDEMTNKKNKFIVSTPIDFDREITISKIKAFIKKFKLDLVAIDGISYIRDERGRRNDNKTTTLTNISEDLMALSVEMQVPIVVAVQSNRGGVTEDGSSPELDNIRDSDGVAFNASTVLSLGKKKDTNILELKIVKQRNGRVGDKLYYKWDADIGVFEPTNDLNSTSGVREDRPKPKREIKDVF